MGLGIPGRTGSTRHTELGALNEIIKRLTDLRNAFTSGVSGDATLAEQQSQTTLLTSIDGFVNSIDNIIADQATLLEQQAQTAELTDINTELDNIAVSLNTAISPTHVQLTNPVNQSYTGFKELSFVCSGTVTVTLDGNAIIYPFTLGTATILGSTIKADVASGNAVNFNGAGTVLITIMQ
jgi:hypothetical protein